MDSLASSNYGNICWLLDFQTYTQRPIQPSQFVHSELNMNTTHIRIHN